MLRTSLMIVAISLIFCSNAKAQSGSRLEKLLVQESRIAKWAVIAIERTPGIQTPASEVIGTGFLINGDGYFVTAAHVLTGVGPRSSYQLEVALRVPKGGWNSYAFDVVGENVQRDVALCKIKGFDGLKKQRHRPLAGMPPVPAPRYATLKISKQAARLGHFVVVAGFPLTSMTPLMQFGNVSATTAFNFLGRLAPARFQVSVALSPGDSGGPVIDLDTGHVIGVAVRGEFPNGQGVLGLAEADPAKWIQALLDKHHIQSQFTAPKALF